MSRFLQTLLSALALVLSMSACSENTSTAEENAAANPVPAVTPDDGNTAAAAAGPAVAGSIPDSNALQYTQVRLGDLDVMEDARIIRILTVYGPGRFYLEDDGSDAGLVAETARMFEQHINDRLGRGTLRVNVLVIPVARNQLIPGLLAGRGDLVIAGLTITPERQEQVDFSIPVSKPVSEILVTGPSAPEIGNIEDLAGETIYVRVNSSYRESVDRLNEKLAAAGRPEVTIKVMPPELEDDDLIEMVNAGLLPWAIVDDYKLQLWKDVFTDIRPREDIVFRSGGRLGWAMRKDSPKLKAAVDAYLKDHREGTLIGNVLRNRWVRDFDWAANALKDDDYARFRELEDIFQRYGEEYGIPYTLAAAQGYQESRLDQQVESAAGAVGIMQLLPSTAADKNVGIPDIREPEPNIHAGIKYLDFLRSRYFSDPGIERMDQWLLALAAYNAGPARITRLRSQAEQAGYDPNVWFDNVEVMAARNIGRETVQYVTNIFRYYLIYRMVAAQELRRQAVRQAVGIE